VVWNNVHGSLLSTWLSSIHAISTPEHAMWNSGVKPNPTAGLVAWAHNVQAGGERILLHPLQLLSVPVSDTVLYRGRSQQGLSSCA